MQKNREIRAQSRIIYKGSKTPVSWHSSSTWHDSKRQKSGISGEKTKKK